MILLTTAAVACGTDTGGGGDDVSGDDAGVDGPGGIPPDEVRFQRDVVPIFNRSCGNGTDGCHNRKTYGANVNMDCRGWLTLEDAALGSQFYGGAMAGQPTNCPDKTLHERLMEIEVWQCRTAPRNYAKANDLAGSYLINKVRGTNLCNADGTTEASSMMPLPESAFTITEADIQTLESWVMAGAKND